MTTQEVLLALATVSSSVLARCFCPLWPRSAAGQHRNPGTYVAGDKRGGGWVCSLRESCLS